MRIQQFIVSFLFIILLSGCTKTLVLNQEAIKPVVVIEGSISNMWGPYYVRVSRSIGAGSYSGIPLDRRDSAEAITNALVIITEDTGLKDTLIPGLQSMDQYTYYIRDTVRYTDITIDSVFKTVSTHSTTHKNGYYQTTKLTGRPGHTYHLEVQVGDSIYRSSAYMPPVPELERIEWVRDTTLSPYTNSGPVPVVWFKDQPNEENYYAFYTNWSINAYRYDRPVRSVYMGTFHLEDFYCFDDKLLQSNVDRLVVRKSPFVTYLGKPFVPVDFYQYGYIPPFPIQIRLHSLTKEVYEFYNTAFRQLDVNGKIYQPTPTSVQGNISGGAFGLFYATAVSDKLLYPL